MAACTELEIEERSSEESSCNAVPANDVAFQDLNLKSRYSAACTSKSPKNLHTQAKVESETGDLKELSDDEFLHLLKEASTFNKPNNQESILLKQLRKEVADTDSCEQVRCGGESSCVVTKRTENKNSKLNLPRNSIESNNNLSENYLNSTTSIPSRTFKSFLHKKDTEANESDCQMLLNSRDGVTFIEVDPTSQWPAKTCATSLDNQSVLEPLKTLCNKFNDQDMTPIVPLGANRDSKPPNGDESTFNNAKSQLGGLPVEFKLEVDPLSTLLIGNYQNFAREIQVANSNSSVSQQNTDEPHGIELTEFKKSKDNVMKNGDPKNSDTSTNKTQTNNQLSSSKFYVNCNDVDTTVTFPLKLVSSMDERNGGGIVYDAMNDQMKHRMTFPCFPWARPQQVHSFLSSADDSQSQSESENSSNPFSRGRANITSFVSATLLDYPNTTLIPDSQSSKLELTHRKHKRTRNHTENSRFILSQNIEGHRGNEDIDSLVKYIEAADKNAKNFHRGNIANNHLITNKSNSTQESLKKKINGSKDIKNHQSKSMCISRKKLSQSNSDESPDNKLNSESECSDDSISSKIKKTPVCSENEPLLDINSNIMEVDQTFILDNSISFPDSGIENSSSARSISPDNSSLTTDFYTVNESIPPTTEESGFCIVKKKQRKKQMKRSENYRWHSAAARVRQSTSGEHNYYSKEQSQHTNGMMLSLVQSGKQDSRRKSTSSVPQSEQSSADNSDLDSVHSLPVRGSAPHPTQSHPHTTPSSSSSTPQASYADIARMPISTISKTTSSDGTLPKSNSFSERNSENKDVESEKRLNGELCSANRSTREINTQTEPFSDAENSKICPGCCCKICTCSKSQKIKREPGDPTHRPAVVMMGNVPTTEASDISFGIDLTEILKISSGNSENVSALTSISENYELPCTRHHSNGCNCNASSLNHGNLCKIDFSKRISALRTITSSPYNELLLSSGQKLFYSDKKVNLQKFNYAQLVDHFTKEWKCIQSEYSSDTNKLDRRVKYYDTNNC